MDGERGRISTYRRKLDDILGCSDLTDQESVNKLVKNQILQSRGNEFGGTAQGVVESRTAEVSTLLEMLRSASATNLERSKSGDMLDRRWNIQRDAEEFRVMYREGPVGTPFHELLVEGFVTGPLDASLCVTWESILYKAWWPDISFPPFRVTSSDCIKHVQTGEQVSLVRMILPWPLSAREALVHYFALEYFENNLMVVVLNSLPDRKNANESAYGFTWDGIPDAENAVRIDVAGGYALLKLNATQTYFRTVARVDPKIDWIIPSLINFVSRQVIASGFKLFKKEVESIGKGNEKYSKCMKGPLYDRIRKALYLTDVEPPEEDKNIQGEGVEVSESGGPKQLTEIDEEEEDQAMNHESSPDTVISVSSISQNRYRKETPPLSPEVKQALETLDNAISMLRGHKYCIEQRGSNPKEEEATHHPVSSEHQNSSQASDMGAHLLMEQAVNGSSLSNVCSPSPAEKLHQDAVGRTPAKGKKLKSVITAALLPSCLRREVKL